MSSMQQWAFLAMQDKEGKLSPDKSSAFQELKNRAEQAGQTLAQYVEPALAVGSGMVGHLAGIAVGAGGIGMGVDAAENAYNRTQDWMTYRPRTESGQAGLEWLGDKSQVVGDAVNKAIGQGAGAVISAIPGQTAEAAPAIQAAITNKGVSKSVEDYITEATGSETAGTVASWVPGAVELVAGGKGIMNAAKLEMGDIGGQGMGNQRGIFAGVKAKGADLDAKARAEDMLAAGADRDQIWKDTGWMKDVDGQWKWEIDDSQFSLNPDAPKMGEYGFKTAEAADVVQHPELAGNYGEMLDQTRVSFNSKLKSKGSLRSILGSDKSGADDFFSIQVNDPAAKRTGPDVLKRSTDRVEYLKENKDAEIKWFMDAGSSKAEAEVEYADEVRYWNDFVEAESGKGADGFKTGTKSTVAHELQHAVQDKEGFASGGNLSSVEIPYAVREPLYKAGTELVTLQRDARSKSPAIVDMANAALTNDMKTVTQIKGTLTPSEVSDAMKLYRDAAAIGKEHKVKLSSISDMSEQLVRQADNMDSFTRYERLAGEAEARNVETRINMTPEQRRAKAPWRTLDVPESELIVQGQGQVPGIQQSVAGGEKPTLKMFVAEQDRVLALQSEKQGELLAIESSPSFQADQKALRANGIKGKEAKAKLDEAYPGYLKLDTEVGDLGQLHQRTYKEWAGPGAEANKSAAVSGNSKSGIKLYHGTNKSGKAGIDSDKKINGPAYFTSQKSVADDYGSGEVVSVSIDRDDLMVDLDLTGGRLLNVEAANEYLGNDGWTIDDYLEKGISVGVDGDVSI